MSVGSNNRKNFFGTFGTKRKLHKGRHPLFVPHFSASVCKEKIITSLID